LRQVSVSARCENQGRQVANSQLLVRGDNRWINSWNGTSFPFGGAGCTGPLYRATIPDPAKSVLSYNPGAAGFAVEGSALPTMRGDVRRLIDNTQVKDSVEVASTAPVTLSGTQTVDGVSVSLNGTRVLIKDQATASTNGIYVKAAGAWTRATDADGGTELDFAQVGVYAGVVNAGTSWFLPTKITIGTDPQSWRRAPQAGLRESDRGGPISVTYSTPLASWYNGACTITQGSNVVTGTTPAASGALTMDNGLLQMVSGSRTISSTVRNGILFKVATGSPLAWGTEYFILPFVSGTALDLDSPSVLTNSADQSALRFRFTGGALDVSMSRGCRTASFVVSVPTPAFIRLEVYNATNTAVFSGVTSEFSPAKGFIDTSYTISSAGVGTKPFVYATSNDADGNRLGLTTNDAWQSGPITLSTSPIGLHAIVGGGTTKTGDDQLYGLSREWFAMLAQQTSAGVL